ncbi:MAG: hypothetical protein HYU73_01945, partial [Betaproteobacteria bacterium]|nr:hypothetical protein [Betaproteobacteria bacterium]
AVAAHGPAQHAIEAGACVHGADYEHVAPMRTVERGIVEADGVGKTSQCRAPMSLGMHAR